MTTDIQVQFGTDDGEKDYCQAIADLIRAEQHDLAGETLMAGLASLHVPLAELCLETRTNVVELTQWDTLQQMIFRPPGPAPPGRGGASPPGGSAMRGATPRAGTRRSLPAQA